ncbi:MAG: TonB-dependent receptor [Bacteroidales bacterium]|nr:TonB-dependent receptor [Bacteroidales bacterium]
MRKKILILSAALFTNQLLKAQETDTLNPFGGADGAVRLDESSFTFSESQLGEDDSDSRQSTVLSSSSNVFSSNAGMKFSPSNYRYRALDNKYNEVYINGILMNDAERGYFRFSQIGGLNNITRNSDDALPFESNGFCSPGLAGSVNYDIRPSKIAQGHKISASLANRTYTGRLMYTYGSGIGKNGWSFAGNLTCRYASTEGFKNVEGAFYNSISYYIGAEKILNSSNTVSVCTFGNPTMRGSRGASTDEAYFLAGSNNYNPYLGYFMGEVRNSRVVKDYAPTTIVTWETTPDENTKISTSAFIVLSKYSNTKLSYNNSTNPAPDYYSKLPSGFFNAYNRDDSGHRTEADLQNWNTAYDYWTSSVNNRYINFDALYYSNLSANLSGADAFYYMPEIHTDRITGGVSTNVKHSLGINSAINYGFSLSRNKIKHYQTMYDLLGAENFHNVNSFALGDYPSYAIQVQYDYRYPNEEVKEGDVFGFDYNIFSDILSGWAVYTLDQGAVHYYATARASYTDMFREGKMQNGFDPNNSYGHSRKAYFGDGGGKIGATVNLGKGHALDLGTGYEWKTPTANSAFLSPEVNNNFVTGLKCENIFSGQLSYAYSGSKVNANLTGYYAKIGNNSKWTCFYDDNSHSFSYVSMTGIEKEYFGAELGIRVKVLSNLELLALGTISDAKYVSDCNAIYMMSNSATYSSDVVASKGMREDGTPLSIASLGISYNVKGWFIELTGNCYDRIYLSFSPLARYKNSVTNRELIDPAGEFHAPDQARGEGGFMLDGSIGKNIRLKKGSLYVGLLAANILNNTNICTGGYEQNRTDRSYNETSNTTSDKAYVFSRNPKKYYAWGVNGMLNLVYKF